ncbi:hypothetical protein J6590_025492 [Homalodisca vitripennis]|nr:hypothetical protein J6590_025492 [Homalodisca vitripennis]
MSELCKVKNLQLVFMTSDDKRRWEATNRAAQGSIYGILRLQMPPEAFLVGYTNEIAAVIIAHSTEEHS